MVCNYIEETLADVDVGIANVCRVQTMTQAKIGWQRGAIKLAVLAVKCAHSSSNTATFCSTFQI